MGATNDDAMEDIAYASRQVRAALSALGWSHDQLAKASGVPRRLLLKLERGDGRPHPSTLVKVRRALEAAGIEFIPNSGGTPGVRLKLGAER